MPRPAAERRPLRRLRPLASDRRKSRILDEHCKAIGRDPLEIDRQVQILVSTDPTEAEATREHIKALIDAGATQIILTPLPPWPENLPARLAEDIIARLN